MIAILVPIDNRLEPIDLSDSLKVEVEALADCAWALNSDKLIVPALSASAVLITDLSTSLNSFAK